jgi:hypothetical protein
MEARAFMNSEKYKFLLAKQLNHRKRLAISVFKFSTGFVKEPPFLDQRKRIKTLLKNTALSSQIFIYCNSTYIITKHSLQGADFHNLNS